MQQRITLLKDHLPNTSVEELMDFIRRTLCVGEHRLTYDDVAAISLMQQDCAKEVMAFKH